MTQTAGAPAAPDALARVEAFLAERDAAELAAPAGGNLRAADLEALVATARAATALAEEVAILRAATDPKTRTGQLLVQTRHERDRLRDTLVEIEELAARHRRGDPYGVQGAAAQQILDVIAEGPTARIRASVAAAALEAAAEELAGYASGDDDPQAIAATWLLQQATEVRAGNVRG